MRRLTKRISGRIAALLICTHLTAIIITELVHARVGHLAGLGLSLLSAAFVTAAGLLVALIGVRALLSSPLAEVREALRRMAEGDLSVRLSTAGRADEIAAVCVSLNRLAERLAVAEAAAERQLAELRQAEAALRSSEERLRGERDLLNAIFDTSLAAITVLNPEGEIIFANHRVEEVLGLTRDRLTGRGYDAPEWHHTDVDGGPWPDERQPFRRVMATGEPVFDVEHAIEWPDGTRRILSVSGAPLRDAAGRLTSAVFLVNDITERFRAQAALRASEERLRQLIQDIDFGVTVHGPDGEVLLHNQAAEKILGALGPALLDGLPSIEPSYALDENSRPLAMEQFPIFRSLRDRTTVRNAVIGLIDPGGGGLTWTLVSTVPQIGPDGVVRQVICSFGDITERRRLEEQLRQSQKMEAVGRLAGGVAHDFNNLLTVITGGCDLILSEAAGCPPELRQDVEQIRQASLRAGELTRQLLAFSRRQLLQPRVISLNRVVAGIERMLRRLIGEDVTLRTELDEELWPVLADPGQIEQVVMNLAVNARDAMPEGGRLTIASANVCVAPGDPPTSRGLPPGCYARLSVSDTGSGIAEGDQEHIFEPFFTTKPQGKGTGLGLATVHGIVTQSGGAVVFASRPGEGARFDVYLPRSTPEGAGADAEPQAESRASGGETVLLAEDDELVRALVRRVLAQRGYQVLEAESGVRGAALLAEHSGPIHLLLTDVVMPGGMSGFDLADLVRSARPDTRVLFMSGYADVRSGEATLEESRFLAKPFTPDALAMKVREVLDG